MWPFGRKKKKKAEQASVITTNAKVGGKGPFRRPGEQPATPNEPYITYQPVEFGFECGDGVELIGSMVYAIAIDPKKFEHSEQEAGLRMLVDTCSAILMQISFEESKRVMREGSKAIRRLVTSNFIDTYPHRKWSTREYLLGLRLLDISTVLFRPKDENESMPRVAFTILRPADQKPIYSISL